MFFLSYLLCLARTNSKKAEVVVNTMFIDEGKETIMLYFTLVFAVLVFFVFLCFVFVMQIN